MEGRRKGTTGSSSERGSGSVVDWQRRKLRGITAQPAKVRSQNCPLGRCTLLLPIGISLEVGKVGQKMGGYYDAPHWVIGHWSRLGQLAQKVYSFVGASERFFLFKFFLPHNRGSSGRIRRF